MDKGGNLYGTTGGGGSGGGSGTVFELTPSGTGWVEKVLYSFHYPDASGPVGVILDQSGNLYGATLFGGNAGLGTVFELMRSSGGWTYSQLYSFTVGGACGGPHGTPVMDGAGNLYGTTVCDGVYGFGNVWELKPSDGVWTYRDLHSFVGGDDGGNPISNVVLDSSGNLYGTTSMDGQPAYCRGDGCGVVWEITP
jgi:hypothetical protein